MVGPDHHIFICRGSDRILSEDSNGIGSFHFFWLQINCDLHLNSSGKRVGFCVRCDPESRFERLSDPSREMIPSALLLAHLDHRDGECMLFAFELLQSIFGIVLYCPKPGSPLRHPSHMQATLFPVLTVVDIRGRGLLFSGDTPEDHYPFCLPHPRHNHPI